MSEDDIRAMSNTALLMFHMEGDLKVLSHGFGVLSVEELQEQVWAGSEIKRRLTAASIQYREAKKAGRC